MAIIFHCEHCNKKIEAADTAGGRWGKCPACHNKIYVPNLKADGDLKLAPIDETDEERKKRLLAETFKLTQDILQERDIPENMSQVPETVANADEKDLTKHIVTYLRQMADGNLSGAQMTALTIRPHHDAATKIIDRIALSDFPQPELADIPPHVLSGFIRSLRSEIS